MEGQRNIVEQIVIESIEDYKKTQRRVEDLLEGEVSKSRVVALARSLAAGEDQKVNVDHLRAYIYTKAGVRLKDTSLIEEGIQIWEGFRPHGSAATSYNLGSGLFTPMAACCRTEWTGRRLVKQTRTSS